jgi:hypothetical protein
LLALVTLCKLPEVWGVRAASAHGVEPASDDAFTAQGAQA